MLVAGRAALKRGVELRINWWGRWAVWPLMAALFAGLAGLETLGAVLLYVGLVLAIMATIRYGQSAIAQLRARSGAEVSSSS
jgi:cardiolipin synthase